ncbi:MAG: hypothetical protein LRY69_05255 [Gammaproteobacteria bacterium]|nr:hypothetical protein [Gammaproteobacteria bacterium]MCD8542799.1 hypothetical protein [Gammaproteobacteria bacterium]
MLHQHTSLDQWKNMFFLPVVNSLVEEQLRELENKAMKDQFAHCELLDGEKVELWFQLYYLWKKSPNKTPRQVGWLNQLKYGITSLRRCEKLSS